MNEINILKLARILYDYLDEINAYQANDNKNYIIKAEHIREIIDLLYAIVTEYLENDKDLSKLQQLRKDLNDLQNNKLSYRKTGTDGKYYFLIDLSNKYSQLEGKLKHEHILLEGEGSLHGGNILMGSYDGAKTLSESIASLAEFIEGMVNGNLMLKRLSVDTLKTLNQDLISVEDFAVEDVGVTIKDGDYCTTFDQTVRAYENPQQYASNASNTGSKSLASVGKNFAPGDYDLAIRVRLATSNTTSGLDGISLIVKISNSNDETESWKIQRRCLSTQDYTTLHIPVTHKGSRSEIEKINDGQTTIEVQFDQQMKIDILSSEAYADRDILYIDSIAISPITTAVYNEVGTSIIKG